MKEEDDIVYVNNDQNKQKPPWKKAKSLKLETNHFNPH